ncbi:MAG: hypothetical protein ACLR2E_24045 [Lachnospiraceae bacterium]
MTAFCEKPLFSVTASGTSVQSRSEGKTPEEKHFDEAGMNSHLVKPVSREKLLNMIHKILKK